MTSACRPDQGQGPPRLLACMTGPARQDRVPWWMNTVLNGEGEEILYAARFTFTSV